MKELKQETATRKRLVIVLLPNASYGFLFDKANQRINWTHGLYSKEGF